MADILDPGGELLVASTQRLDEDARWFLDLLRFHGVSPPDNSPLGRALQSMGTLARSGRGDAAPVLSADQVRVAAGTAYQIKSVQGCPGATLERIVSGDWGVFGGPDICLTVGTANTTDRNKAWEILVAAICSGFAEDVRRDEPDVRCRFDGRDWGLACKFIYSSDRDGRINAIVEGAKQLERSSAEVGLVVVNATNLINHDAFLLGDGGTPEKIQAFHYARGAIEALNDQLAAIVEGSNTRSLVKRIRKDKIGISRRKTLAVLFFAQTAAAIRGIPAIISSMCRFEVRVGAPAGAFLDRFRDVGVRVPFVSTPDKTPR